MNRRLLLRAALGVALSALTGCNWFGGTAEWQEEVLLSDGRKIVIAVKVEYQMISEIGGPSTRVGRRTTLRVLPDQGIPKTEWSEDLAAVLLDIDAESGELLLVGAPVIEQQCARWGAPCPRYVEFRFRDGRWRRQVPFSEALFGRPVNLLQKWGAQTRGPFVTLEQKRAIDSDIGIDLPFKCILKSYKNGC